MPFLFKSTKRRTGHPNPSLRIHARTTHSALPELSGKEDAPILGIASTRTAAKSRSRLLARLRRTHESSNPASVGSAQPNKGFVRSTSPSGLRVHSATSHFGSTSSKASSTSSPGSPNTLGIAELVFDPYRYTTLLSVPQASRAEQRVVVANEDAVNSAGTPRQSHSREASATMPPCVPPCTPDSSPARSRNLSESSSCLPDAREMTPGVGRHDADALMERITYDAILASALHRNLGLEDDGGAESTFSSETRAPPNSPVSSSPPRGEFGSLMGASLAILERASGARPQLF